MADILLSDIGEDQMAYLKATYVSSFITHIDFQTFNSTRFSSFKLRTI